MEGSSSQEPLAPLHLNRFLEVDPQAGGILHSDHQRTEPSLESQLRNAGLPMPAPLQPSDLVSRSLYDYVPNVSDLSASSNQKLFQDGERNNARFKYCFREHLSPWVWFTGCHALNPVHTT